MIELRVKRNGEELLSLSLHDSLLGDKTTQTLVSLLKSHMTELPSEENLSLTPLARQVYTAPLFVLRALEAFGGTSSNEAPWQNEFIAYLDTTYPEWTTSPSKKVTLNYQLRNLRGYGCLAKIQRGTYTLTAEGQRQLELGKQLHPKRAASSAERDALAHKVDVPVKDEN